MAYVTTTRGFNVSIMDRINAILKTVSERNAQYRTYKQTVTELENLSARELADLGLHRSMIKTIAMEAAYGK